MTPPAKILLPGLHYDVEDALYFSDPCPLPSLSASVGRLIAEQSPLHGFMAHPRLGKPKEEEEDNAKMDFGSVGHKLLLGRGKKFVIGEFDDWKTKDSRAWRTQARASGLVPILKHQHERALAMRDGALKDLERQKLLPMFEDAQSEVVAISLDKDAAETESGGYCRIMMDKVLWMADGHQAVIFDVKISEVMPNKLRRHVGDMWYDHRSEFYKLILGKVAPKAAGRIRYVFLFIEPTPPFCVVPVELSGAFRMIGVSRCDRSIELWKRSIQSGEWPGYTTGPIYLEPLSYQATAEDEAREGFSAPPKY